MASPRATLTTAWRGKGGGCFLGGIWWHLHSEVLGFRISGLGFSRISGLGFRLAVQGSRALGGFSDVRIFFRSYLAFKVYGPAVIER